MITSSTVVSSVERQLILKATLHEPWEQQRATGYVGTIKPSTHQALHFVSWRVPAMAS
jgi:hypothetical protein